MSSLCLAAQRKLYALLLWQSLLFRISIIYEWNNIRHRSWLDM